MYIETCHCPPTFVALIVMLVNASLPPAHTCPDLRNSEKRADHSPISSPNPEPPRDVASKDIPEATDYMPTTRRNTIVYPVQALTCQNPISNSLSRLMQTCFPI